MPVSDRLPARSGPVRRASGGLDFWRRQARWLLPMLLLLGVHEVGSKFAGRKLAQAEWPKAADRQAELQRGSRVRWHLAAQPAQAGAQAAAAEADGGRDSAGTDAEGAGDLDRPKPEAGVLVHIDFLYNRPLHCAVLLVTAALAAAWLVRVHPLWLLPVLVYTCSKVQEFYPVTHWPMYSNPSLESSWYCYLADGEGRALPVRELCGETAPKLKKRMRSLTEDLLDRDEYGEVEDREDLPAAAWRQCAETVLRELVQRSEEIGKASELPSALQLVRVDIRQQDGTFVETPRILGELAGGTAPAASPEPGEADPPQAAPPIEPIVAPPAPAAVGEPSTPPDSGETPLGAPSADGSGAAWPPRPTHPLRLEAAEAGAAAETVEPANPSPAPQA